MAQKINFINGICAAALKAGVLCAMGIWVSSHRM